ncbi:hypothetical protein ONZ43_g2158 [Nemania bipapillata]|uniref:Uncharacterized protein n=1 Tax=Nemania bipapillata TaxID=110536 RepID=A0ACC2J1M3_9PEZI|nr:hypothetical protein ONZ43_g2158 [Nemania bipapillata]
MRVSALATVLLLCSCDFYTQKTIGDITPANQQLLMTLVLHSALLGPYSQYNTVPVDDFTGALYPREYQGSYVDLSVYFNGALASANTGKDTGEAVNFLDDGGLPLARQSKPGNGNTTSNQYVFFTHVYSYFGTFLGCSTLGTPEFPPYAGRASMYEVHKYMDLNAAEMGYFVEQAVKGLISFGFSNADAQFVNATLTGKFDRRCAPAEPIIPASAGPQLQAICIAPDCSLSANDTCSAYGDIVAPAVADAALVGNFTKDANGQTSLNTSGTAPSATPTPKSGSARLMGGNMVVVVSSLFGLWAIASINF